jgi:hypothetical protein
MVFSAVGRTLGIAPGVAFNSYNDGLFRFLGWPAILMAATSLLIVMLSPALKGDEGETWLQLAPAAARTHDFKKHPHQPAFSPWTRPLFGSKLLN